MKGLFIGLTTIDLLYPIDRFLIENEKSRAKNDRIDLGGPAMNAAYAFSALGGEATLITWVGKHAFTSFMHEKFDAYQIEILDLNPNQNRDPIISAVMINLENGSRTIVTSQVDMNIEVIPPHIDLAAYDVLCVDGFFGDFLMDVLEQNNRKIPVVFDGGSYKDHTNRIMPWINYPILSGHFIPPNDLSAWSYVQQFDVDQFAITHGERPIEYFDHGHKGTIEIRAIDAVDTLAAGDVFHGAFSKFILTHPTDFPLALKKAGEIASHSCAFIGAREWAGL